VFIISTWKFMNQITPLSQETREALTTEEAAPLIRVKPPTMRKWALEGNGPIQPLRYNKRKLLWRVSDLRALLAGA
jgi:hypothetical protein